MKASLANLVAAALFSVALACPQPSLAEGTSIKVHVTGLNSDKGVMRIALFNNAAAYTADKGTAEQSFKKAIGDIKNNQCDYVFTDVPNGDYAIKAYHDEDNSGKFYTGMFGIPKVQYGFSNNAKAMFGPPSFAKAQFPVTGKDVAIDMKLQGG